MSARDGKWVAVGVKLLYPDNTIQHAGCVVGMGGIAGHMFVDMPAERTGYLHKASLLTGHERSDGSLHDGEARVLLKRLAVLQRNLRWLLMMWIFV